MMNDLSKYLKTINSLFPIYGAYEKRFFSDLKANINEFIEIHPNLTLTDLENHFGTPSTIISEYLSSINTEYLTKQLSRTKMIRVSCICIFCSLIVGLGICTAFNYKAYLEFQDALPAIKEIYIETDE